MAVRRVGGDTSRVVLIIFSFVLWAAGLGMIFLGVWMLVDPRRSYVLELVHFSADDPLLVFAAYTSVCAGVAALAVGFIACCGALKRIRCMITCLMICMFLLSLCGVAIGTLGLVYRDKFPTDERITRYLTNLTYDRYSRQKWVAPLMDTMQFYEHLLAVTKSVAFMIRHEYGVLPHLQRNQHVSDLIDRLQFHEQCCGLSGARDWRHSDWARDSGGSADDEGDGRTLWRESPNEFVPVPQACCTQLPGSSALNTAARSFARCQHKSASSVWRHQSQQCCGGEGARDYYGSFWYVTNTERGTRSFVPASCCRQQQKARAWVIAPLDPLCTTFAYDRPAIQDAVHSEGCGSKLHAWFNEQTAIFAGFGFGFAALQVVGMGIALIFCNSIHYGDYIKGEEI